MKDFIEVATEFGPQLIKIGQIKMVGCEGEIVLIDGAVIKTSDVKPKMENFSQYKSIKRLIIKAQE